MLENDEKMARAAFLFAMRRGGVGLLVRAAHFEGMHTLVSTCLLGLAGCFLLVAASFCANSSSTTVIFLQEATFETVSIDLNRQTKSLLQHVINYVTTGMFLFHFHTIGSIRSVPYFTYIIFSYTVV